METKVTIDGWQDLLAMAESGRSVTISPDDTSPEACLIRGYLLLTSQPEKAKELLTKAQKSDDRDCASLAAVYEARAYEYLGQCDEGRILIRAVLDSPNLNAEIRALGMVVLSIFQSPGRAQATLREIDLDGLRPGLKARICTRLGRLLANDKEHDKAFIEYAGATTYYEEASDLKGAAHAHNNVASVLRRLGKYVEAHESVDTALRTVGDDAARSSFLDQKARIFLEEQKFIEAENYARQAVEITEANDCPVGHCENLCTLGRALWGQRKYHPASEVLSRARSIAERMDSAELLFMAIGARRRCAEDFVKIADVQLAELALKICDGSYRAAGKMLNISHTAIIKQLEKNSRRWKPKRPQSIICKSLK